MGLPNKPSNDYNRAYTSLLLASQCSSLLLGQIGGFRALEANEGGSIELSVLNEGGERDKELNV